MHESRATKFGDHSDIASVLVEMGAKDQGVCMEGSWEPRVDRENTARLKDIIEEIGWPTISKVGVAAANCAWLIAQHADHDVEFQEFVLGLMKLSGMGECESGTVAYLEDRVRVNRGLPQVYGTQLRCVEGQWEPHEIFDPGSVDERRASVGLGPFSDYLREHSLKFQPVR